LNGQSTGNFSGHRHLPIGLAQNEVATRVEQHLISYLAVPKQINQNNPSSVTLVEVKFKSHAVYRFCSFVIFNLSK
jgi:hypothetical protein